MGDRNMQAYSSDDDIYTLHHKKVEYLFALRKAVEEVLSVASSEKLKTLKEVLEGHVCVGYDQLGYCEVCQEHDVNYDVGYG